MIRSFELPLMFRGKESLLSIRLWERPRKGALEAPTLRDVHMRIKKDEMVLRFEEMAKAGVLGDMTIVINNGKGYVSGTTSAMVQEQMQIVGRLTIDLIGLAQRFLNAFPEETLFLHMFAKISFEPNKQALTS